MTGSPSKSRHPRPVRRSSLTPVKPAPAPAPAPAPRQQDAADTDVSTISEGIPRMRENLRNIIDMMGDDECTDGNNTDCTVAATESACCENTGGSEAPSGTSCHCCGKQTSSESGGDCCSCNAVQPQVHKTPCARPYGECIDIPSMDTIVAKCRYEKTPRVVVAPPRCISNQREYSARQHRGYSEEVQYNTSSSEECPCEGPCPGKHKSRKKLKNFINKVVGIRENIQTQQELYKFRLKENDPNFKLPRRLVFDLVDGIPTTPPPPPVPKVPKKPIEKSESDDSKNKVDVYYFDHGNSGYYRTTDHPPPLMADFFIEQTDLYATRFWAEIFGTIHIGFAFITSFILQLCRFVFYSLLRPLTVGVIQLASDYFFKPLLSIAFNGIIQPILILMYNIATSFRDLCEPIAQGLGYFLREIASVFRSVRLVEINKFKNGSCNV